MNFLYSFAIHIFYSVVLIASLFNKKAQRWVKGRRNWVEKIKAWQPASGLRLWFHAASLGEFEQGIPVMEAMKKRYPSCNIIVTFFSPSGYENRKKDPRANLVTYLPLDTKRNARKFIQIINPDVVFFIKYEFWYNYLSQLTRAGIPVYLVSAIFRPSQAFFKWYGRWYINQLKHFKHIFVQDADSLTLLNNNHIHNCSISGDTRFDRVKEIAEKAKDIAIVESFVKNHFCLVAGSTWPGDEEILCRYIDESSLDMKFVLAPHEISPAHIQTLTAALRQNAITFSKASVDNVRSFKVLIIDNIGMLSSIYRYGNIAYIGGGFGKGIHNILEAAVYGIPVIFGPNYRKFREAVGMAAIGAALPVNSYSDLKDLLQNKLLPGSALIKEAAQKALSYVGSNTGAAFIITDKVSGMLMKRST